MVPPGLSRLRSRLRVVLNGKGPTAAFQNAAFLSFRGTDWTKLSTEYANQRNYLDDLFKVYPMAPETVREINEKKWAAVEEAFQKGDKTALLKAILKLDLFPIKDSYVAYLKRDPSAVERNPETISRLYGRLVELGLHEIYLRASSPKETNRQIGPLFSRWLQKKTLGVEVLADDAFLASKENAVLAGGDEHLKAFAQKHLNYRGTKGLDFIGRFNSKFVVGEAKFLTDFGGHQNAQFEDAKVILHDRSVQAVKVAILDGVLYIPGKNKMYAYLEGRGEGENIVSSLLLREFLYQI